MTEPQINEEEWDKKKILIVFGVSFFLLFLVVSFEKDAILNGIGKINSTATGVKGASTQNPPSFQTKNIQSAIQNQLETVKKEAQSVDIAEIASSSPQVQKVINDLKALQRYPTDQVKSMCEKICSGL